MQFENFAEAYQACSKRLMDAPEEEVRGLKTREIIGAAFSIEDTSTIFELPTFRDNYLMSEVLWYAAGGTNLSWITKFSSFWSRITNQDKLTINSNYGFRIFRQTPCGPIAPFFRALRQLQIDLNTRQAIVHINWPGDIAPESADIPCTVFLQFFVRNNRLHLISTMRSNDIWKGLTFDIPSFYVFQQTMLYFLQEDFPDLELGAYYHRAGSFHVYEPEYDRVSETASTSLVSQPFKLSQPMVQLDGQPTAPALDLYMQIAEDPTKVSKIRQEFFV